MADSKLKVSCASIDCPERKGDACQFDLDGTLDNLVRDVTKVHPMSKGEARRRIKNLVAAELRQVRTIYEAQEVAAEQSPGRRDVIVSWRGWKMVRNVITDRIEKLTGSRI